MKYIITIEETLAQDFIIEADSPTEAKEIAQQKYQNSEIVLEPGELHDVKFSTAHLAHA